MTVVPGDVIRVTAKMSFDTGDAVQNVYHYQHQGASSITDTAFMTALQTELNTVYGLINAYISSALSYDTIEAFNVTQDTPIDEQAWTTLTLGAENTSQAYATQVAGLVKFATTYARSQGRKYIAGLAETGIDGKGFLVTAVQTALGNYAAGLVGGFTSGSETFRPGNWNSTLSRFATWSAGIIADYVGTQRRRRVGSGA